MSLIPFLPKSSLAAIYFVGKTRGWAVGDAGTIIATTDGGETWQPQESGTPYGLLSVHFANEKEGWVVGENGLILKTADGGANWLVQISNITSHLYCIRASNAKEVYAVGLNGTILSTNDGGITWARDFSDTSTALRAVDFKGGDGWVAGEAGAILKYGGKGSGRLKTVFGKKR